MKILKILLLIVTIFACIEVASAQTFKIVGIEGMPKGVSERRFQEDKAKMLGSKLYLETFKNDIKVTYEIDKDDPFILPKKSSNLYEMVNLRDSSQKVDLKLNTVVYYITGGELQFIRNDEIEYKILFERDGIF